MVEQRDRARVGRHAVALEHLVEGVVLAVAEPAHGRRSVAASSAALGQVDAARRRGSRGPRRSAACRRRGRSSRRRCTARCRAVRVLSAYSVRKALNISAQARMCTSAVGRDHAVEVEEHGGVVGPVDERASGRRRGLARGGDTAKARVLRPLGAVRPVTRAHRPVAREPSTPHGRRSTLGAMTESVRGTCPRHQAPLARRHRRPREGRRARACSAPSAWATTTGPSRRSASPRAGTRSPRATSRSSGWRRRSRTACTRPAATRSSSARSRSPTASRWATRGCTSRWSPAR